MKQKRQITIPCPCCGHPVTTMNGLYLRTLRETAGMTQRQFGETVGVSSPYISDIERNRRRPPPEMLAAYLQLAKKDSVIEEKR